MYIRQKKPGGKWYFTIYTETTTGKRKKIERVGGDTKSEAREACRKFIREQDSFGRTFQPKEITVNTYLMQWLDEYVESTLTENTIQTYRTMVNRHIIPYLGNVKLYQLKTRKIQNMVYDLNESYSYRTISMIVGILKKAFRQAITIYEYIDKDPMKGVVIPKPDLKSKANAFKNDDLKKIFDHFVEGDKLYVPIQIAYHTGMRAGEVLALAWDVVDFKNNSIIVKRILYDKNGYPEIKETTKTKTIRRVSMDDSLKAILKAQKAYQSACRKRYGKMYEKTNMVCTDDSGAPLTSNNIRWFNLWCKTNGIDGSFHTLRHTFATKLLEGGMDLDFISKQLGHSTVSVTSNVYVHMTDQRMSKSVKLMNEVL